MRGILLNIWDSWVHLLGNVFVVWFEISDPISLMNIGCDKCCDVFEFTHTSFLAYRVCCLQPGAPYFGVGVRPAGEDQQG